MQSPRIFCVCYSHDRPTGGQKDTYRHVDALISLGFEAFAVHDVEGFRLTWFDNDTPVVTIDEFERRFDAARDYVVLPEDLGQNVIGFPGRKVIFNKSIWSGFGKFGESPRRAYPYTHPEVVAAMVMSEHNRVHLEMAYPRLPVVAVKPDIDTELFTPVAPQAKERVIAWVPKNEASVLALMHILGSRAAAGLNTMSDVTWRRLSGLHEREVAGILARAMALIFFSAEEGLGRLPLEAMASGCLVLGFRNGSLQEIVPPETLFEWGRLDEVAHTLERITASFPGSLQAYAPAIARGRQTALDFSSAAQQLSVAAAWERILAL